LTAVAAKTNRAQLERDRRRGRRLARPKGRHEQTKADVE
jgi:hypothetical protein